MSSHSAAATAVLGSRRVAPGFQETTASVVGLLTPRGCSWRLGHPTATPKLSFHPETPLNIPSPGQRGTSPMCDSQARQLSSLHRLASRRRGSAVSRPETAHAWARPCVCIRRPALTPSAWPGDLHPRPCSPLCWGTSSSKASFEWFYLACL